MNQEELNRLIRNADIDGLLSIFDELNQQTRREVISALESKLDDKKKQQVLARVRQANREADKKLRVTLPVLLSGVYLGALAYTSRKLIQPTPDVLTGLHKEAVNRLVSDSYVDFASGMNGLVRGTERRLNDAIKQQIRSELTAGKLTGEAVRDIADNVETALDQQGFTALIDRGGRKWALTNYADMLAQTHVIGTANEATINRMSEFGVDIVEVSRHGATDKLCAPHEGKIYSISGTSVNYPKGKLPSYHPRCKHSILPRPDLS